MNQSKQEERTEEEARKQSKEEWRHLTGEQDEGTDAQSYPMLPYLPSKEEEMQQDGEEERECEPHHHKRWRGWRKDIDNT